MHQGELASQASLRLLSVCAQLRLCCQASCTYALFEHASQLSTYFGRPLPSATLGSCTLVFLLYMFPMWSGQLTLNPGKNPPVCT